MKRILAAVLTVAILGLVLRAGLVGRPSPEPQGSAAADDTPQACIERMFAAAEQKDVDAYLECFSGPQRESAQRQLQTQTREGFAQSLASAVAELQGLAMTTTPGASAGQASVAVERIYRHHNEQQTYQLRQVAGRWRIEGIRSTQSQQPLVPFGTHVSEIDLPAN